MTSSTRRPPSGLSAERYIAAIETREVSCDRQPQSGAGFLAVPAFPDVEDDFACLGRKARPIIVDQNSHMRSCLRWTSRDLDPAACMLEGIVEQVRQDLVQILAIARDAQSRI